MMLLTVLAVLILIAAVTAAVGAWRQPAMDVKPLADLRLDLATRLGELKPLHDATARISRDLEALKGAQSDALATRFQALNDSIQEALRASRLDQGDRLDTLQAQVQQRLEAIQKDSAEKLERMRQTVDEKLHETLEKRLGESFNLVAQRLELVQKGLGEMQSLAQDVGGLKRVLTNVKTRGTMGEVLLESLLTQFLAPGQFERQKVLRPGTREAVDIAVRVPTPPGDPELWIPIDAKFPTDDYERLQEASERGDLVAMEQATQDMDRRLIAEAKSIKGKYLEPPSTTNYAVLYLPTEGLYAEVLRRPMLVERLQREHCVVVLGPTTLAAFLNVVQMGHTNLAISNRSVEVWKTLGEVKAEFGKFAEWVEAVQKKFKSAADEMDKVGTRTRAMGRRLQVVQDVEPLGTVENLPAATEIEE